MTVYNREKERVQTVCTPKELAEAIGALNLASIPPQNRHKALIERLNQVMLATTTDPRERNKEAFRLAETTAHQLSALRSRK